MGRNSGKTAQGGANEAITNRQTDREAAEHVSLFLIDGLPESLTAGFGEQLKEVHHEELEAEETVQVVSQLVPLH